MLVGGLAHAEAAQATREAVDAVHEVQPQGVGPSEGTEPGVEAMGDRQNHRPDVARSARGGQDRVRGGLRE